MNQPFSRNGFTLIELLAIIEDIQPDRFRTGAPNADRTSGSANYLYAAGNVASIHAAKLKTSIDAGENPARPPEAPD